jgi:hypothetical protein
MHPASAVTHVSQSATQNRLSAGAADVLHRRSRVRTVRDWSDAIVPARAWQPGLSEERDRVDQRVRCLAKNRDGITTYLAAITA